MQGDVLFAGEEAQEGPALLGCVVADRSAQRWVAGLQCIEHRGQRDWSGDIKLRLVAGEVSEAAEVLRDPMGQEAAGQTREPLVVAEAVAMAVVLLPVVLLVVTASPVLAEVAEDWGEALLILLRLVLLPISTGPGQITM